MSIFPVFDLDIPFFGQLNVPSLNNLRSTLALGCVSRYYHEQVVKKSIYYQHPLLGNLRKCITGQLLESDVADKILPLIFENEYPEAHLQMVLTWIKQQNFAQLVKSLRIFINDQHLPLDMYRIRFQLKIILDKVSQEHKIKHEPESGLEKPNFVVNLTYISMMLIGWFLLR